MIELSLLIYLDHFLCTRFTISVPFFFFCPQTTFLPEILAQFSSVASYAKEFRI